MLNSRRMKKVPLRGKLADMVLLNEDYSPLPRKKSVTFGC